MTIAALLSAELCDSPCSVADCLDPAQVLGSAVVSVNPSVGVPPDLGVITLGLPLCAEHAHLLRPGCTLTRFTSGL
jgi:hypothetical protein